MSEVRSIDANALKENLLKNLRCDTCYKVVMINLIDSAPTVEERPQGEWKEFKYGLYYCSRCYERVDKDIERIESLVSKGERSNYCPVCGAKMGGTT